jgi:hypothetical protein
MLHSIFSSPKGMHHFINEPMINAGMMLATALVFSLGGLLAVHSYLLLTNKATLEMNQLDIHNPFNRTKNVVHK